MSALSGIEARLNQLGSLSPTEKEAITGQLQTAYSKLHSVYLVEEGQLPEEIARQLSEITYLFGRTLYGGEMESTRCLFKLATAFQLVGMNLMNRSSLPNLCACPSLDTIAPRLAKESPLLPEVDKILTDTSTQDLVGQVTGHEGAFSLGVLLRWMMAPEQNLEAYKANVVRFEKIFGIARTILETVKTPDSQWEIAGIIYNGERYVQALKEPADVDAEIAVLKKLQPYIQTEKGSLRSKKLEAQIENITGKLLGKKAFIAKTEEKLPLLLQQFEHCSRAVAISESVGDAFDPFLKTLFLSNKTKTALDCQLAGRSVATNEELNTWSDAILKAMEEADYSHAYHPLFLLHISQLRDIQKNLPAALALLEKADKVNEQFPLNSDYEALKKAIKIKTGSVKARLTGDMIGKKIASLLKYYPPLVDSNLQPKYGKIALRVVAVTATAAALASWARISAIGTAIVVGGMTVLWERFLANAARS